MSRIKQCFKPDELPRVWLSQTQDTGRTSDNLGGKFYFTGDTIYSYGAHFPIARIYDAPNGEQVILLTTRTNSHTTNGHIQCVKAAARRDSRRVVYCYDPSRIEVIRELYHFKSELDSIAVKHAKARKPELYAGAIFTQARLAREWCEVMCLPVPSWAMLYEGIEPGAPLRAAIAVSQTMSD